MVPGYGRRGLGVDVLHETGPELDTSSVASEELRLHHSHEKAGISLGVTRGIGLNNKRGQGLVLMRDGT